MSRQCEGITTKDKRCKNKESSTRMCRWHPDDAYCRHHNSNHDIFDVMLLNCHLRKEICSNGLARYKLDRPDLGYKVMYPNGDMPNNVRRFIEYTPRKDIFFCNWKEREKASITIQQAWNEYSSNPKYKLARKIAMNKYPFNE